MSTHEPSPESEEAIRAMAYRLLKETAGILDRQQRIYALGKKLGRFPTETLLELFRVIIRQARLKDPVFADGFRVISDVRRLGKHVGMGKMSEVYTLARRRDYLEVVRLLQSIPPARKLGVDEELEEDPMLKEMSLGTKRQKARLRDRDLINRLCNEQDPIVIQHLLKNPIVTIREVVKIASKRPTAAQILWVVYRDIKWINHYVVKMALVNNPYTPTELSLSLLPFLLEQDLEDVSDNMLLHDRVKEFAAELIMVKRKAGQESRPDQDPGPDREGAG